MNNRMMVRDSSVGDLMDSAYRSPYTRTVFPRNLPGERFDVLATLPGGPNQTLQNELRKRFNLTAHREERTVNVLLLKVRNPNPPSLKVSEQDYGGSWVGGDHEIKIANSRLDGFISNIETTLGVPVINQTDLDATYDLRLNWRPKAGETDKEAFRRALSEQLGLQLVPSRQPIEMLVVDPVK